jgi:hypothetical protein
MANRKKYNSLEQIDNIEKKLRKKKEKLAAARIIRAAETGDDSGMKRMGEDEVKLAKRINALHTARRRMEKSTKNREAKIEEARKILATS